MSFALHHLLKENTFEGDTSRELPPVTYPKHPRKPCYGLSQDDDIPTESDDDTTIDVIWVMGFLVSS